MMSVVTFAIFGGFSFLLWAVLKPIFPKLKFTSVFSTVFFSWFGLIVFAIAAAIYLGLGILACLVVSGIASLIGMHDSLIDFVHAVSAGPLSFLPPSYADDWPALLCTAVIVYLHQCASN